MSDDVLPPPTNEVIRRVRAEYNLDDESIKQAVEIIKEWLALQPHLPQENDDDRLERWLLRCKNSVEKTKKALDAYYTLKTVAPEIMCGWNTTSDWFRKTTTLIYSFAMPKLTPDFDRVILMGYLSSDASEYDPELAFKVVLSMTEIRICEDYNISDIVVISFKNLSFGHFQKYTIPILKKLETCVLTGFSTRLKQLHFLNVNTYGEKLIAITKLILKPKLAQRIYVHGNDMSSLHKLVPKNVLPTEMGGDCGPLEEHWNRWKKKLETYNDWFLDHEKYKSDESKRSGGGKPSTEMFGFEGSFRKLAVD